MRGCTSILTRKLLSCDARRVYTVTILGLLFDRLIFAHGLSRDIKSLGLYMIDYYSLLANAVADLGDRNTAQQRRGIYARGRDLILNQFGAGDPAVLAR
jgi:hypothetical protein